MATYTQIPDSDIVQTEVVQTVHTPQSARQVKTLFRGTQIVWYILNIIEVILLFRFALKLLGANPSAGFTSFIYSLSYPFAAPFVSVFNRTAVAGSVFEWSTLLAMFVYWLVAWGIVRLIVMGKPVSTVEAHSRLEEQDVQK